MLTPTPARKPTPKTTSFDQGSHHELRASLPTDPQAIVQIAPNNAQNRSANRALETRSRRVQKLPTGIPRPPPSHPFSSQIQCQTTDARQAEQACLPVSGAGL